MKSKKLLRNHNDFSAVIITNSRSMSLPLLLITISVAVVAEVIVRPVFSISAVTEGILYKVNPYFAKGIFCIVLSGIKPIANLPPGLRMRVISFTYSLGLSQSK